jgi:hypothetical protein
MNKTNKIPKTKKRQKGNYVTTTIKLSRKCLKMVEKACMGQSMSAFIEATVWPWMGGLPAPPRRAYRKYKLVKKTFTFTEEFIFMIRGCGNVSTYIEQELMERIKR